VNKPVVKELIQQDCNPENIANELDLILNNKSHLEQMMANYNELHEKMGLPGASAKTAKLIIEYSSKNKALL
jgi:lipid-A-disaccharide synthase